MRGTSYVSPFKIEILQHVLEMIQIIFYSVRKKRKLLEVLFFLKYFTHRLYTQGCSYTDFFFNIVTRFFMVEFQSDRNTLPSSLREYGVSVKLKNCTHKKL